MTMQPGFIQKNVNNVAQNVFEKGCRVNCTRDDHLYKDDYDYLTKSATNFGFILETAVVCLRRGSSALLTTPKGSPME
jgi:hypothetical protein